MANPPATKIKQIPVEQLRLDPANPRLPEGMDGTVSTNVIQYYWDHYVLDELIDSYRENGYFEQEPMIVKPEGGKYIVLEGNRRLAALIQLLRLPGYVAKIDTDEAGDDLQAQLAKIPCFVSDSREEVASYLGFKHIGGIKPWPPEAKARFISNEIRRLVHSNYDGNPFAHVGRMVGTNAQSIRLSFYALELLHHAKNDHGLDINYVANHRFGVWLRCMSSKGIAERLSIQIPSEFSDFDKNIKKVDRKWLRTLIGDLTPKEEQAAILSDSRDVTVYGYIIANDNAYKVLRETKDLKVAEQIVSGTALATKIDNVTKRVSALQAEAERLDEFDQQALEAARALAGKAKTLVNALREEDDE